MLPNVRVIRVSLVLFIACAASSAQAGEQERNYFLKDTAVGTEAGFNPFTVMLNSGFDILRNGSYQNQLHKIDYATGARNIFNNAISFNENIKLSGGWNEFIAHEVFPYKEFNLSHGHFVPNYFLHVLGEGMLYRKLGEWYRKHEYPYPRLLALGTIFAAQYLNESVENGGYVGANTDPIADLVFFNPLGWLLFSFDEVARFFSEDISLGFWPGQPSIDLSTFSLYNAGESYFFRGGFEAMGSFKFFAYIGAEGVGGLSWKFNETDSLSVAGGYRMIWLRQEGDEYHRRVTPVEPGNWLASVFWDRDDSLLASVKYGVGGDPTLRVNLYPGFVDMKPFHVGAFFWASEREGLIGGVNFSFSPVGLAVQSGGDQSRAVF